MDTSCSEVGEWGTSKYVPTQPSYLLRYCRYSRLVCLIKNDSLFLDALGTVLVVLQVLQRSHFNSSLFIGWALGMFHMNSISKRPYAINFRVMASFGSQATPPSCQTTGSTRSSKKQVRLTSTVSGQFFPWNNPIEFYFSITLKR
jgi:hypothetical protein